MQGTQPDNEGYENMEADWYFQENEPDFNRLLSLLWYHGQWKKLAEDEEKGWKSLVLLAESQKPEEKLQLGWISRIVKSIPLGETENICKYLPDWIAVEQLALQRAECGKAARSVLRGVRLARGVSTQPFWNRGTIPLITGKTGKGGIAYEWLWTADGCPDDSWNHCINPDCLHKSHKKVTAPAKDTVT